MDQDEKKIDPRRFLDLCVFHKLLHLQSEIAQDGKLDSEGRRLAAAATVEFLELCEHFVDPVLAVRGFQSLKPKWDRLAKPKKTEAPIRKRGEFVASLYAVAMARKPGSVRELFDGPSLVGVKKFSKVAESEDLRDQLTALNNVYVPGPNTRTKQYVRAKLKELGFEVSDFDNAMQQAAEARDLGNQIRVVESRRANESDLSKEVELRAESKKLQDEVEELASESKDPNGVRSIAVEEASKAITHSYATELAKKSGLSPAQEDAMMATGKVVLAATAGSGKTATMANAVNYHIQERGIKPQEMIVTSFSSKSAYELVERVRKIGGSGVIPEDSIDGFGTTHRVSSNLLNQYDNGAGYAKRDVMMTGNDKVINIAMKQVEMRPNGLTTEAPGEKSFFDFPKMSQPVSFQEAVSYTVSYHEANPNTPYASLVVSLGKSLIKYRKQSVSELTSKQAFAIRKAFERAGVEKGKERDTYTLPSDEVNAAVEPTVSGSVYPTPTSESRSVISAASSPYYKEPANQFFNLGSKLEESMGDKKRKISAKEFGTFISNMKGDLISPSEAWHKAGKEDFDIRFAAVYCAYEWLKANDPTLKQRRDHDDILIQACQLLVKRPDVLSKVQASKKVIIVDESQDQNQAQHLLFGLIAGYYNPETQAPNDDGSMTADTYSLVGDANQCISVDSLVDTPNGPVKAGDLAVGQEVMSFRNGEVCPQAINHKVPSGWTYGYRATTESGKSLLMSPNHRLYATEVMIEPGTDHHIVYLMYRHDMGYRVGVTNKGAENKRMRYGLRTALEGAEKFWVLDVVKGREEALFIEQSYSLRYGIPTCVFNGKGRGLNQKRIEDVFSKFGANGAQLLHEKNMSFEYPNWVRANSGMAARSINLNAHARIGNTQVSAEFSEGLMTGLCEKVAIKASNGRYRLRRHFESYREALSFAKEVRAKSEAAGEISIRHRLSINGCFLPEITASALHPHMSVPVLQEDGSVKLEKVISVEKEDGKFLDLDVGDASNFFANGILSHNSIYEFRSARPELFINKALNEGFTLKELGTNYRSGSAIVEAANRLIEHNKGRIPMECRANPPRGEGNISYRNVETHSDGAHMVAEEIKAMLDTDEGASLSDFGIACRTVAEQFAYCSALATRGISFRCPKVRLFQDNTSKALISWLNLMSLDKSNRVERNKVVLEAHRAPNFNLNKTFNDQIQSLARGEDYIDFLANGGWEEVYDDSWRNERFVRPYLETLQRVESFNGSPSECLNMILSIEGTFDPKLGKGGSIIDSLVASAMNDPEIINSLVEEKGSPELDPADFKEVAMAPIEPLMGIISSYQDISVAMSFVEELREANKDRQKKASPSGVKEDVEFDTPAVTVDTVHGWKGLEAKHFYVPMAKDVFPHKKSVGGDQIESERRLAYVALTRGRDTVTVICPSVNHHGKPSGVSSFIGEACIRQEGEDLPRDQVAPFGEEEESEVMASLERELEESAQEEMESTLRELKADFEMDWE